MNMDYSKVFELLNQDTEKERNEKAEKAVHDNLYNKGFRDGLAALDKIRTEIIKYESDCRLSVDEYPSCKQCTDSVFRTIYGILDKCKAETEEVRKPF